MRTIAWMCALAVGAMWLGGCTTTPKSETAREDLMNQARATVQTARSTDPGLQKFFDTAAGYAVFPNVGKGAFVAGGAYGRGVLFEKGQPAGYCTLTQASVGLAAGGQAYKEVIFFETPDALNRFKAGNFALAAQASAVALKSGASANARYENGVLVVTFAEAGLMAEASVGGQKFSYQPLGAVPPTEPSPTARTPSTRPETSGSAGTSSTTGTNGAVTTPTSSTTRTPR